MNIIYSAIYKQRVSAMIGILQTVCRVRLVTHSGYQVLPQSMQKDTFNPSWDCAEIEDI